MNIRDDVGRRQDGPPDLPKHPNPAYFDYDRVLISCPECGYNHLAALTCPPVNALIRRHGLMVVDEPEWHADKVAA